MKSEQQLTIAFDAKRAVSNRTGLGNYSRYVVDVLTRYYPKTACLLYSPKINHEPEVTSLVAQRDVRLVYPPTCFWRRMHALWRTFRQARQIAQDDSRLFHGLSNELPYGIDKTGKPSVVTIHDLIFLRFPQFYPLIDRIIYTYKFRYAVRKATRVIAVSECTKRDIVHFFRIDHKKIDVIYQGCNPAFQQPVDEQAKQAVGDRYNLPSNFILTVGTLEERKNLQLIVEALPLLPKEIMLVAVGRQTAYTARVLKLATTMGVVDRIRIIDNVTHTDLPAVYRQARLFCYPSRYEGFGIPIIEALHSGIPVVACNGSCLEEAGGEKSKYVFPDDPQQLADAINHLLDNPQAAQEAVEYGKEYVKRFSDRTLAAQIHQLYTQLVGSQD